MKKLLTFLVAATIGYSIQAQMPAVPATTRTALVALRAKNESLLKQQASTLVTLQEMKETARQLKIFARRG